MVKRVRNQSQWLVRVLLLIPEVFHSSLLIKWMKWNMICVESSDNHWALANGYRSESSINAVFVVPACENILSSTATLPGDVVKSMSGTTIEVLNTDAEGRLILADALTYTQRYKPKLIIDMATLTGACVVALGAHHSGL